MARTSSLRSRSPAASPEGARWIILADFRHKGVIYSPGEAVPRDLDAAARAALLDEGKLRKITGGGRIEQASARPSPQSAGDYLTGNDTLVLMAIRQYAPDEATLRAILEDATQNHRSQVLLEALKLRLGVPYEGDPV